MDLSEFNERSLGPVRAMQQKRRRRRIDRITEVDQRHRDRAKSRDDRESENGSLAELAVGVLVTFVQQLNARLFAYETAAVKALQRNEAAHAAEQARMTELLAGAFSLPDGRYVFRTENGSRVFDEDGTEVSAEELDPMAIPEHATSWEDFRESRDRLQTLRDEREEILIYEERLKEAGKKLESGDMTPQELDDLSMELESAMPAAVRREIDGPRSDPTVAAAVPDRHAVSSPDTTGKPELPAEPKGP